MRYLVNLLEKKQEEKRKFKIRIKPKSWWLLLLFGIIVFFWIFPTSNEEIPDYMTKIDVPDNTPDPSHYQEPEEELQIKEYKYPEYETDDSMVAMFGILSKFPMLFMMFFGLILAVPFIIGIMRG